VPPTARRSARGIRVLRRLPGGRPLAAKVTAPSPSPSIPSCPWIFLQRARPLCRNLWARPKPWRPPCGFGPGAIGQRGQETASTRPPHARALPLRYQHILPRRCRMGDCAHQRQPPSRVPFEAGCPFLGARTSPLAPSPSGSLVSSRPEPVDRCAVFRSLLSGCPRPPLLFRPRSYAPGPRHSRPSITDSWIMSSAWCMPDRSFPPRTWRSTPRTKPRLPVSALTVTASEHAPSCIARSAVGPPTLPKTCVGGTGSKVRRVLGIREVRILLKCVEDRTSLRRSGASPGDPPPTTLDFLGSSPRGRRVFAREPLSGVAQREMVIGFVADGKASCRNLRCVRKQPRPFPSSLTRSPFVVVRRQPGGVARARTISQNWPAIRGNSFIRPTDLGAAPMTSQAMVTTWWRRPARAPQVRPEWPGAETVEQREADPEDKWEGGNRFTQCEKEDPIDTEVVTTCFEKPTQPVDPARLKPGSARPGAVFR